MTGTGGTVRRGPVTALLDATGLFFKAARDAFPGAVAADWAEAAALDPGAVGPEGAWRLDFRCFAVADPDGAGWTLVDAGVGPAEGPGAPWCPVPGRLPDVLADAGIDRADVHTVVLTHLHEDHTGWAADAAGRPFFPQARYVVQRAETAALDRADPVWSWVVEPLREAGQLHEVDGEHRLRPGVTLLPTPGHTPGHQSVLVGRPGGRDVLVTGDLLVHAVQLANPAVAYAHERDPAAARASREELLARAVESGAVLATAHLTRPFVEPPDALRLPGGVRRLPS
ncbi:MBL fold metallo-hydrolase [Streptomyces sp. NBC_00090]|uniref:MBL fold metallo-hydrolase n=1 Tax=Streptomyces sp. NBC_00090 TaxID=2903619 RepID=UPI0032482014